MSWAVTTLHRSVPDSIDVTLVTSANNATKFTFEAFVDQFGNRSSENNVNKAIESIEKFLNGLSALAMNTKAESLDQTSDKPPAANSSAANPSANEAPATKASAANIQAKSHGPKNS